MKSEYLNLAIIILVTIAAIMVLYFIFAHFNENLFDLKINSYEELQSYIQKEIDKSASLTVLGLGLSVSEANKQIRQREDIRRYIRLAPSGDRGARKAVNQLVKDKLLNIVNEKNIEKYIPFSPEDAEPRTKLEALIYILDSRMESESSVLSTMLVDDGFRNLVNQYEIGEIFDEETLSKIYEEHYLKLQYMDKVYILTQILFADIYGLGSIDTLNYQMYAIEEIQIGLKGPQTRAYDYRNTLSGNGYEKCAKDDIEILFNGRKISLSFLGFTTDTEMQRVIRNTIINSNAGELTEKTPRIATKTVDGRRVVATRPPQTDAWTAFIRKFNTIASVDMRELYKDELLCGTIENLVRSGAHIGITGEMEGGKTTLLRSALGVIDSERSIRIIEYDALELNGRSYFPEKNITSLLVTKELDEESVLALVRKMSGQIFCIGEVNSLSMANLCNKVSKIASQVLFSAHYTTTENMVSDFKNAKLCNGFSNERLAEIEAVEGLNFDIHIVNRGKRYVGYINEIILTEEKYKVVPIMEYDLDTMSYTAINRPSEAVYKKAKRNMKKEQYEEFVDFFEKNYIIEQPVVEEIEAPVPTWVV